MSQQTAAPLRSRVPRIAGAAVERARLTVVPRTRTVRAPRVPFVLFVSAILLMGVVGLLMFNTSMQQASFTISTYQEQAASLAAREEQLTAELEKERDPQTLGLRAQREGMVLPDCTGFLDTVTGRITGEPCVTTGDNKPALGEDGPPVPRELDPVHYVDGASSDGPAAAGDKNKAKTDR